MGNVISKPLATIVLEKMQECVGKYRFYFEHNRPKNDMFIEEFALTEKAQIKILMGIKANDYCESEESLRFQGRYIHVFAPNLTLKNLDKEEEQVTIYVKFEIREIKNGETVAVISFHRPEFPIIYAFS